MSTITTYSLSEEIANSVSHGIGALLAVAALTLLLANAVALNDTLRITSASIYGGSLVVLFLSSTLYHAFSNEKVKQLFKLFDHCAIYLLIAGTYTPLMLISLNGQLGYTLLSLIWTLAIAGIVFKIVFGHKYKKLSLVTYLGLGLISLLILDKLQQNLSSSGIALLAGGGAFYCLGVIFYVKKTIPYNHAIWHLFVLAGAACHFFMIWQII